MARLSREPLRYSRLDLADFDVVCVQRRGRQLVASFFEALHL